MARYRFRAFTRQGQIEAGEIDANSANDALNLLAKRGLTPFETVPTDGSLTRSGIAFTKSSRSLSLVDYGDFARQLATLLEADLPIDQTLRLLAEKPGNTRQQTLAVRLHKEVASGSPLSMALEKVAPDAPPYFSSLVKAGEARGNLGATLSEIAWFIESRVETSNKIKSAMTYPAILAIAAVATVAIMISVLVPALLPLFEDAGVDPPPALRLLNGFSIFIGQSWQALTGAFLSTVLTATLALRNLRMRAAVDALRLKIPFFGDLHCKSVSALFAHTIGTLSRAGVPLVSALNIAGNVLPNMAMASAVRIASNKVVEGSRLSAALGASGLFPDMVVRLISIGEESGQLDTLMMKTARILDQETERKINRGMTLLGPLMTVVIGLGVGSLLLSVMQAILSVNELVMR